MPAKRLMRTHISLMISLSYILFTLNLNYIMADELNPGVYSVNSQPYNIPFKDWTAKWWQWFIKIPNSQHPFSDTSGEKCAVAQEGPVWFLLGAAGNVERSCTIPSDKAILVPILVTECSYSESPSLKSESELRSCAVDGNNGATVRATLDGKDIKSLDNYRVTSNLFPVIYSNDPIFPTNSNVSSAVSDGWFIMLEPLQPGAHDLKFSAFQLGQGEQQSSTALIDVNYHITSK